MVINIFLVMNVRNSPGKIACIFDHDEDARAYIQTLPDPEEWEVSERLLWLRENKQ